MRGIEELSELLKSDEINSLGKDLGKRIQDKLERSGIYFHIFARVKEAGSIWHKLEWKKEEYLQKSKSDSRQQYYALRGPHIERGTQNSERQ